MSLIWSQRLRSASVHCSPALEQWSRGKGTNRRCSAIRLERCSQSSIINNLLLWYSYLHPLNSMPLSSRLYRPAKAHSILLNSIPSPFP
ncbi:Uncharacterized protein HZ326_2367 [Fusarium oxysporum f. sp. albedinis]|nr:Uncharacterized protein HZ326_2367 [Fusarium oxysporum f. sp. albedinis]